MWEGVGGWLGRVRFGWVGMFLRGDKTQNDKHEAEIVLLGDLKSK